MNSLPALIIFDLGAIRSFLSQSFSRDFDMVIGELECSLRVSIANEHKVSSSSVFCDYTLEIFGVPYLIDLIYSYGGYVCDRMNGLFEQIWSLDRLREAASGCSNPK